LDARLVMAIGQIHWPMIDSETLKIDASVCSVCF
jgi:hypothetical protein